MIMGSVEGEREEARSSPLPTLLVSSGGWKGHRVWQIRRVVEMDDH